MSKLNYSDNANNKDYTIDDNDNVVVNTTKSKYPRSVPFIVVNKCCERFCFYGARTVLVLYMTNVLKYSEDDATVTYSTYNLACSFTPLLGAIIADSLLGRYRTILYLSIVCAAGTIVLSYASYLKNVPLIWVGMLGIALGSSGINPCVAPFGADQFAADQEKQKSQFFSLFYLGANVGGFTTLIITPLVRDRFHCMGRNDCFPLAFGVPALVMVAAVVLFLVGRYCFGYVMLAKSGSAIVDVIGCVSVALYNRIVCLFRKGPKREHWLDYADHKFDARTVRDIKAVMRVMLLFIPLPIFWSLYDQQGSQWTLMATKMDGRLAKGFAVLPDQMGFINPILICFFIPLFEYGVYPLLTRLGILKKPLQRMVCGGCLTAISFCICAFFQIRIEGQLPPVLRPNAVHLTLANGLSSDLTVTSDLLFDNSQGNSQVIHAYQVIVKANVELEELSKHQHANLSITLSEHVGNCLPNITYHVQFDTSLVNHTDCVLLLITDQICAHKPRLQVFDNLSNVLRKPVSGGAFAGVVFAVNGQLSSELEANSSFEYTNDKNSEDVAIDVIKSLDNDLVIGFADYKELDVHIGGDYQLNLAVNNYTSNVTNHIPINSALGLEPGGSYMIMVHNSPTNESLLEGAVNNLVLPNSVSMLWQLIQYTVLTAAEIMFIITGYEFCYSQAPDSMKSVVLAAFLITDAFGNLIIIFISKMQFFAAQSNVFFLFATIMFIDIIVFAVIAYYYVPYNRDNGVEQTESDQSSHQDQSNE